MPKQKLKPEMFFRSGRFVFTGDSIKIGVHPESDGKWIKEKTGFYSTSDFKAAVLLKNEADGQAREILDRAFVKLYSFPLEPLPDFLDSHQVRGVNWILSRSRSYLAHAPGAGKTMQAVIGSIYTEATGCTVFVVPPQLTLNWSREIQKVFDFLEGSKTFRSWWPTISIIPESAKKESLVRWNADFFIVPDSMLTRDWVLKGLGALNIKFLAVDEASRFKESSAQRTIALFGGTLKNGVESTGLIHGARHAVLMDGSPMSNRPMELWAPTYAMAPETINFMTQEEFGFRYCGARMNDYGRWEFKYSSHEDELKKRLRKSFMHVVGEEELGHPERLRGILVMNKDVRCAQLVKWEKEILKKLKLEKLSEGDSKGELATVRRELGLRKVKWVADYVSDRIKRKGESILLFTWHREVSELFLKELSDFDPGFIIGGISQKVRDVAFNRFQVGNTKLLIGNIAAMGRGLNLQKANRVVFAEFSWTDELNRQCEKRASRKGSENEFVRCDYIVCPGSLDEPILNAVMRKAETVKKVIG